MPLQLPPSQCPRTPTKTVLQAGSRLWRVHAHKYPADAFYRRPPDREMGGGRFDTRGFPYLYAAPDESTALAETLLRSVPFDDRGRRLIPRAAIRGKRLSAVEVTADLALLRLVDSVDLAGICTDEWLIHTEPANYDITRRWSTWLHQNQSWAKGLEWQSKRDLTRRCVMLFDRCVDGVRAVPGEGYELDDPDRLAELNALLAPYGAVVNPPRR